MDIKLDSMMKLSKAALNAEKLAGKTVVKVNEDALLDGYNILQNRDSLITFGVKNTSAISRNIIKNLINKNKYVWLTIDELSSGGRAVDVNLVNPISGRVMTGSSSATAINVLYGINDVGIGTDGGGSILAPALSLNLFSIMGKGLGLKGNQEKSSTDGILFEPAIGVMGRNYDVAEETIIDMINNDHKMDNLINDIEKFKIVIPKYKNIILPDGIDMREHIDKILPILKNKGINIYEKDFPDFLERKQSIEICNELFQEFDLILTYEGPIDYLGYGDSVFGVLGDLAKHSQNNSGKYMVKIANMLNSTAVTIPDSKISSGYVVTAAQGLRKGSFALKVANVLKNEVQLPQLYNNYFLQGYKRRKNDLIFSTNEN
ncbi:MAG: hypothetical protein K0R54_856 [Clostridiaceae bacterium]|jgi:hypothetical protein|nr:hypothetical protein [Clostridiaceae bacterium]